MSRLSCLYLIYFSQNLKIEWQNKNQLDSEIETKPKLKRKTKTKKPAKTSVNIKRVSIRYDDIDYITKIDCLYLPLGINVMSGRQKIKFRGFIK